MDYGKTIQFFLPDGNPRSIKIAEITSRTVQAILIPRSKLGVASLRDELGSVGVYYLVGSNDEAKPLLYVGEAENCLKRLNDHNKAKDFWTHAIAIVSKTQYFTKSHVKFLESFSYEQAKEAGRYLLENNTIPTKSYVPEATEADLMDNFDTIRTLVSTLGYPFFDVIKKSEKKKDVLVCKGKNAYAEGEYTEDGMVVFKGSKCNKDFTPSTGETARRLKGRLITEDVLYLENDLYVFTQDYIFTSPSSASDIILARSSNGWTEWKYKNGKNLDQVKRQ